jgi:choline monooxygenase
MFELDPDVARARTPPARIYTDPAVAAVERERIFARTWQLVAHTGQLGERGDYVTAELAGEPIVVTRDAEGIRAFHNVCKHRAGPVAVGCGRRQTLQCRYHGWTYSLAGRLLRAPDMDGTADFCADDLALSPVRIETLGPLVFANLDAKAPPLGERLDDIPGEAERLGFLSMRHVLHRAYTVACNWKVYVDNYLEGYHIPIVHPTLFKELDFAQYRVEPRRWTTLQHAPLRPAEPGRHYQPTADDTDARYWWVFPNVMLNAYQGQLQTNVIVPLDSEHTVTLFDWFAPDAKPPAGFDQLVQFSDDIQKEDIWICEAVQKNLHSTAWTPGRYCAKHESSLHHFHRLLRESLAEGAGF